MKIFITGMLILCALVGCKERNSSELREDVTTSDSFYVNKDWTSEMKTALSQLNVHVDNWQALFAERRDVDALSARNYGDRLISARQDVKIQFATIDRFRGELETFMRRGSLNASLEKKHEVEEVLLSLEDILSYLDAREEDGATTMFDVFSSILESFSDPRVARQGERQSRFLKNLVTSTRDALENWGNNEPRETGDPEGPPIAVTLEDGTYEQTDGNNCAVLSIQVKKRQGRISGLTVRCQGASLIISAECNGYTCQDGPHAFELSEEGNIEYRNGEKFGIYKLSQCNTLLYAGACWFLGPEGQSCSNVCNNQGMTYSEKTKTVVGYSNDASKRACGMILDHFEAPAGNIASQYCTTSSRKGLGCYSRPNSNPNRLICYDAKPDSSFGPARRVCGCK